MGKRNKNLKELYPNALPITLSTDAYNVRLPEVIPHNPISWLVFGLTYLYIQSKPVPTNLIRVDLEDGAFKVQDSSSMNRLWSHGFFGKGSLSRSDPSWAVRTSRRLGLDDESASESVSEEITKQRREERKRFKLERAKIQSLELKERQETLTSAERQELETLKENLNSFKQVFTNPKTTSVDASSLRDEDEALLVDGLDLEFLQLQNVEAFFLQFALNTLSIYDEDRLITTPELFRTCCLNDSNFVTNYAVYHHFRSLGWCVRSGIKFGCDMLLYKRGPPFSHAEFGVLIIPSSSEADTSWIDISAISRVIGGVKKTLVLCYVQEPEEVALSKITSVRDIEALLEQYKVTEILYRRWTPSKSRD